MQFGQLAGQIGALLSASMDEGSAGTRQVALQVRLCCNWWLWELSLKPSCGTILRQLVLECNCI